MSKKLKQKRAEQGMYALCITVGLFLGFGLGAIVDNLLVFTLAGAVVGTGVAWYFNHANHAKHSGKH